VNNDFCLTFDKDAKILELMDDGNIQKTSFDFMTLEELGSSE
jgi:hypothetical protein